MSESWVRSSFDYDNRGLMTLNKRIWVPYLGGARHIFGGRGSQIEVFGSS